MYGYLNEKFDNILGLLSTIDSDRYNAETFKSVTFQVTNDCNLRCTYCYQHCKNSKTLDFETAKKFIDGLFSNQYKEYLDFDKLEFVVFDFIGGEPFLAVDVMSQIVDYIELKLLQMDSKLVKNHMYSITSNGTLYHDEKVQAFLKKYDGLLDVSITVDGNKDVHDACRVFSDGSGSYDLAHEAQLAVKNKYHLVGTKITLSPNNLKHLAESFIDICNDGFNVINMNCVFEDVWQNIEDIRELYKQGRQIVDWLIDHKNMHITSSFIHAEYNYLSEDAPNWCGGAGTMISISPNKNIYPCQRYSEISMDDSKITPFIIGDVDAGVLTRQSERDAFATMDGATAWKCSDEECRNCPIASSCSYCSAFNYETYGDVMKRTKFHCKTQKVRYLISFYYFYKSRLIDPTICDVFSSMDCELKLSYEEILDLLGKDLADEYSKMSEYLKSLNLVKLPSRVRISQVSDIC